MKRFVLIGVVLALTVVLFAASSMAVINRFTDPSGYSRAVPLSAFTEERTVEDEGFLIFEKPHGTGQVIITAGSADYCCDDDEQDKGCSEFKIRSEEGFEGSEGIFNFKCANHKESDLAATLTFGGYLVEDICGVPHPRREIAFAGSGHYAGEDNILMLRTPGNNPCLTVRLLGVDEESCTQYVGICYADIDVDGDPAHTIEIAPIAVDILLKDAGVDKETKAMKLSPEKERKPSRLDKALTQQEEQAVVAGAGSTYYLTFNAQEDNLAGPLALADIAGCKTVEAFKATASCNDQLVKWAYDNVYLQKEDGTKVEGITKNFIYCKGMTPCVEIKPLTAGKYKFCYKKGDTAACTKNAIDITKDLH